MALCRGSGLFKGMDKKDGTSETIRQPQLHGMIIYQPHLEVGHGQSLLQNGFGVVQLTEQHLNLRQLEERKTCEPSQIPL